MTWYCKLTRPEGRVFEEKNMCTENLVLVAEREAEAAVVEFLEMRAAILGRLSPEALRCVADIFERRMEETKGKKNSRF